MRRRSLEKGDASFFPPCVEDMQMHDVDLTLRVLLDVRC